MKPTSLTGKQSNDRTLQNQQSRLRSLHCFTTENDIPRFRAEERTCKKYSRNAAKHLVPPIKTVGKGVNTMGPRAQMRRICPPGLMFR